jgi:hypothetical protein
MDMKLSASHTGHFIPAKNSALHPKSGRMGGPQSLSGGFGVGNNSLTNGSIRALDCSSYLAFMNRNMKNYLIHLPCITYVVYT